MDLRTALRESRVVEVAIRAIDLILAPLLLAGLVPARLLRELGIHRLPVSRWVCDRVGVLPVHDHFYQPLIRPERHLARPLDTPRDLPGIDLGLDRQLELLRELASFSHEAEVLARPPLDEHTPTAVNDFYGPGDADVLYLLLRQLRPRQVIEIGSGHSTKVAAAALRANARDGGAPARHICIEPYENPWLERLGVEFRRERIEAIAPDVVDSLDANDVLFIDASHVIRPQGDVLRVFLELLPRLRAGVVVHVHDIFTPRDYPRDWIVERRRLWNEQYLVEAMLSGGDRYEILLALNHLANVASEALAAIAPAFREHPDHQPGALWFRTRI